MRISKRRYHNELLSYSLAARMVALDGRTESIRRWSGLSEGRIRELYRAYEKGNDVRRAIRHRGPPPRQPTVFLKTAHMRNEAAALAALCYVLEVIPSEPLANARKDFPSLQRGEVLCRAYEMYQALIGAPELTLDHAMLLVAALAQGTRLRIGHCICCGGAIVYDPYGVERRRCSYCAQGVRPPDDAVPLESLLPAQPYVQQSLF